MTAVKNNFEIPYNLVLNFAKNNFSIVSDAIVLLANVFYDDKFSTAFWVGDLFYLIAVMQPNNWKFNFTL